MESTKRPVLVFTDDQKTEVQGEAKFLGFGFDFAEFDKGMAIFTVAIVEWKDGTVNTIFPTCIQFLDTDQVEACHVD